MNGGGGSSSSDDTVMRDVMEGYDSTSDDDFEIILGPPRPACVSCARCQRLFHYHAEFLNHIDACLARERMIKEQKGKGQCYYQFNAPHDDQRGGAGPSSAAPPMRALNLFNDPLELRLAPPGPPPPPPSLSLELTLAIGRNRPGGFRQQPGNNNNNNNRGIGPGAGNVGKNFKK